MRLPRVHTTNARSSTIFRQKGQYDSGLSYAPCVARTTGFATVTSPPGTQSTASKNPGTSSVVTSPDGACSGRASMAPASPGASSNTAAGWMRACLVQPTEIEREHAASADAANQEDRSPENAVDGDGHIGEGTRADGLSPAIRRHTAVDAVD